MKALVQKNYALPTETIMLITRFCRIAYLHPMKVVIPLAGAGKRLRPFTYTQPKPMIPVAGKPIIGHIVDELVSHGFTDFVFILGYLGHEIRAFIDLRYPELQRTFVHQQDRRGLGHAIWTAKDEFKNADGLLIVLGDLIFQHNFEAMMDSPTSELVTASVDDPREFGVVETDGQDRIIKAVEKPRIPKSNRALVGIYKILEVDALIDALDSIVEGNEMMHGELQLTSALQKMIENDVIFKPRQVDQWFDCGRSDILLKTNALLLKNCQKSRKDNRTWPSVVVIPPVYIGENCHLESCIVGPNATIGNGTSITSSVIKNSIIGTKTTIENVVLNDSVIGNDSTVIGFRQRLNIGDNTEIDLFQNG